MKKMFKNGVVWNGGSMDAQIFGSYRKEVQQLTSRLDHHPGALQELLHLIEQSKDTSKADPVAEEFFKGEYAFYSGHYERALKHYLQCKGMAQFEFFCYRSSAFIFKAQGNIEKAFAFIKKALEICPEDRQLIVLQGELLNQSGRYEEAQQCVDKAKALAETFYAVPEGDKKAFGDKNFQELVGIFSVNTGSQDLFAEEQFQSVKGNQSHPSLDLFSTRLEGEPILEKSAPAENDERITETIHAFQNLQSEIINDYLEQKKQRAVVADNTLFVLNGCEGGIGQSQATGSKAGFWKLLNEARRRTSGGIFLRWKGKGVVINPGRHFLNHFHQSGLHIRDIHFVIVTQESSESYADIKEIYELTYQLNRASNEFHLVHYYLNQKAFHALNTVLKPLFKQERGVVHNLELFIDSDVESIELSDDIRLHYFLAAHQAVASKNASYNDEDRICHTLGIRLELSPAYEFSNQTSSEEKESVNLGFISGVKWSPAVAHHLKPCHVLLAGLGQTSSADYHQSTYLDHHLGYHGVMSLWEKLKPELLLCTEIEGNQGDLRLEIIKQMRRDQGLGKSTTILPAENGLVVDLENKKIKCSLTNRFVNPQDIQIVRSGEIFSRLLFLAPSCCL